MANVRTQGERAAKKEADVLSAVERTERATPSGSSAAAADGIANSDNIDIPTTTSMQKEKIKDFVSLPAAARTYGERRSNGHAVKPAASTQSWRDKHERKASDRRETYKNRSHAKADTKGFDRRWAGRATPHLHQREEVAKPFLKGVEGAEDESVMSDVASTSLCYVKMLISNQLAGMVIGNTGQEVKRLKEVTGAKIVLSPHGTYFPGTTERLVSAEGKERSVFQVIDWIIDRMHELASAKSAGPEEKTHQLKVTGTMRSHSSETGNQDAAQSAAAAATPGSVISSLNAASPSCDVPLTCKLCVPRAVVGSLIGRQGGYIQSVRVATEANINISPLFVTADEACAERIITIESPRLQSLRTATFTLARKINSHPEKATCKHMCYYRKFSFEPSPLALIEENRRERVNSRFAVTEFRTTTAESQSRLVSAENESGVGSTESLERLTSMQNQRNNSFNHRQDPLFGEKTLRELTTNTAADLLYRHSVATEDVTTERDVSCFSAASTATSATKLSSPFDRCLSQSSLSKIGSARRPALSSLPSAGVTAVRTATGSSLTACKMPHELRRETLSPSLSAGFFTRTRPVNTSVSEDVKYAVPSTEAARPRGTAHDWTDHPDESCERHSHRDGTLQRGQDKASDCRVNGIRYVLGCSRTPDTDKLTRFANCRAERNDADVETEDMSCNGAKVEDNGRSDIPDISSVQMRRDLESTCVGVTDQAFQSISKMHVGNQTSCSSEIFAEERIPGLAQDEAHYIPYALSRENLSTVCSTAAGSIATLTTILQGIHEEVPDQHANTSRGGITTSEVRDLPPMKNALKEASAIALQLCRSRQLEQRGSSAPEGFVGSELQSFPPFDAKHVSRETELAAAAAAQFASVIQNSVVTGSAVGATPCTIIKEKTGTALDPAAAEFFPSSFTLAYPFQQTLRGCDQYSANAVPTVEETVHVSQKSTCEEKRQGVLQQHVNITIGADAIRMGDNAVEQTTDKEKKKATGRNLQCLSKEADINLSSSPAVFRADSHVVVSAIAGDTKDKHGHSDRSVALTVANKAASTEEFQQTPSSKVESSVKARKSTAEERQRFCSESGITCTAEQEDTKTVKIPNTLSASGTTRFASLPGITTLASWSSSLLECSLPTFMTIWTTAVVAGLLLSVVFAYIRSP